VLTELLEDLEGVELTLMTPQVLEQLIKVLQGELPQAVDQVEFQVVVVELLKLEALIVKNLVEMV
jgi:hypothetical protein